VDVASTVPASYFTFHLWKRYPVARREISHRQKECVIVACFFIHS